MSRGEAKRTHTYSELIQTMLIWEEEEQKHKKWEYMLADLTHEVHLLRMVSTIMPEKEGAVKDAEGNVERVPFPFVKYADRFYPPLPRRKKRKRTLQEIAAIREKKQLEQEMKVRQSLATLFGGMQPGGN